MVNMFTNWKSLGNGAQDSRAEFVVKDIHVSVLNAVRRIILSEIPNVAFYFDPYDIENNDIRVLKNTGVLHNEFLAHRISLVPLHFTENEIATFKPDDYKFILKVKNTGTSVINVTTEHIEILGGNGEPLSKKKVAAILPPNPVTKDHILITKLKPNLYDLTKGNEIDIECRASKNIAKVHSRWCPTSQCCYMNVVDEEAAEQGLQEKLEEAKKERPDISTQEIKELKSKFDTLDKYRFFKRNQYDEPSEFLFKIESECKMRPAYMFFKALTILIDKVIALKDNINDESKVVVSQMGTVPNFYQLCIKGENHTLLNVMQSLIYHNEVRLKSPKDRVLEYVGYYQPHPLDEQMYLKLKFKSLIEASPTSTKEFIVKCSDVILSHLHEVTQQFIQFTKLDKQGLVEVDEFLGTAN